MSSTRLGRNPFDKPARKTAVKPVTAPTAKAADVPAAGIKVGEVLAAENAHRVSSASEEPASAKSCALVRTLATVAAEGFVFGLKVVLLAKDTILTGARR